MRYRRILIFKPGAIGDLLQISPVVRVLKRRFPDACLTMVVGSLPSVDLYRYNPLVDEIIVYDKRGSHGSFSGYARLWRELRRRRFDLVINYQRSNLKGWGLLSATLPARILVYHRDESVHAVENHLMPLSRIGIDPSGVDRRLFMGLDDSSRAWARNLLEPLGHPQAPRVALNPGASHPVNRWPVESFAALAERLVSAGVTLLLVGGPDDRPLAEGIMARVMSPVTNLVGKTTLLQLGAILERCDLVVSGDTGPMHMATAVGTRVLALFGAADPNRTGPMGEEHQIISSPIPCVPCRSRVCRNDQYLECMTSITVEEVAERAIALLAK